MWVVTVISPWEEPREYVLKAGKTMLGRHPGNDIVIPDDASSRLHAEIDYDLISNAITVRDLDSTNGTWVNRQRIREVQPLRVNDQIHVGQHLLTLIQRDHSTSGRTARLHSTQPLAHENVRQSIDKRAPVLYEVANLLNTIVDLRFALSEVARLTRVALSADDCRVYLSDELNETAEFALPRALLRHVLDERTVINIVDLALEPQFGLAPRHIHATLCVPGITDDEAISVTAAYRLGAGSRPFEDFDVELAVAISHEVAVTVQRLRLLDKARAMTHQATADRLTGLHNRRHFLTLAEQEFHRARRYRRPLAALVLDIDSFKSVNEQHGHAAGDQVLRSVADGCSANLREPNLLCRFGDDQFVVLLLECDQIGARVVAERLLRQVAPRPIDTMTGPVAITLSAGYAVLEPNTPSVTALIEQAELHLYTTRTARSNAPASAAGADPV
jgi:diguanylate cyclase (GGDEF)-like protein